jgi:hypothetical protein
MNGSRRTRHGSEGNAPEVAKMVVTEFKSHLHDTSLNNILSSYVVAYAPYPRTHPDFSFWRRTLTDSVLVELETYIKELETR